MKLSLTLFIAGAAASPLARQGVSDTANGFDEPCADLAVIFARGTFDSGNVGPWVGGPFRNALAAKFPANSVAFQGVSAEDYPADLSGYIDEGGSNSCATSLATAVTNYSTKCPNSKIVISGWSQGALCAHKSFAPTGPLNDPVIRNKVIALTTFGDPVRVWDDSIAFPILPTNTKLLSYCQQDTPDPLCTNPLEDFPREPKAFIDRLKAIWRDFSTAGLNAEQRAAIADIAVTLPQQATKKIGKLGHDILAGHLNHWLLTPQHFLYGVGQHPMVVTAAEDIYNVYQTRK